MGKHVMKVKRSPFSVVADWVRESLGNEGKRGAIYGLATAVLAVLSAYGLVTADDAARYGEAIATGFTALATLLARANTGVKAEDEGDVILSVPAMEGEESDNV